MKLKIQITHECTHCLYCMQNQHEMQHDCMQNCPTNRRRTKMHENKILFQITVSLSKLSA